MNLPLRSRVARAAVLIACAAVSSGAPLVLAQPADDPFPGVNPLREDRAVWVRLLSDHPSIVRTVVYTPTGVEATTESSDPEVASRIVEHAKAMRARIEKGARVRVWDPVFAALFERHGAVRLEVTPTERGVRIVESSDDPEAVALMWSHAAGVSDFVRHGHESARRETERIPAGSPVPAPEVAIGGMRHRLLLDQPDAAQVALLKDGGVTGIVNYRKPAEHAAYDEAKAAQDAGLAYWNLAFKTADEATDAVFDAARKAMREAEVEGRTLALHCRTGNRVGAAWAAFRVLDCGVPVERAIAEARVVRMTDPLLEARTREYIRARSGAGAWAPVEPGAMTEHQAEQRRRAVEARDAVFTGLFAALTEAMQASGPAGAIGVCKEKAPEIAGRVAEETGVMIGRTSDQLRNAANTAPAWAPALFSAPEPREADGFPAPRFAANTDGSFGASLPIRTVSACLACHGPAESIDPRVRDALAAAYPSDRATGYREGDLRGWFWVEVPGP